MSIANRVVMEQGGYSGFSPAMSLLRRMPGRREPGQGSETLELGEEIKVLRGMAEKVFGYDLIGLESLSAPLKETVSNLVDLLDSEAAAGDLFIPEKLPDYLPANAINVMTLTLLASRFLNMSHADRVNLGLGAFLRDMGMKRIPISIWGHDRKISDHERLEIQAHPVIGRNLVQRHFRGYSRAVQDIVYLHHEREDGSGYLKLPKNLISLQVKLVAAADAFTAMISPRRFRKAYDRIYALQQLLMNIGAKYDRDAVFAICGVLSLFPVKSHVTLNDGTEWEAAGANEGLPLRPRLKSIDGSAELDLGEHPYLVVKDQLRYLNMCADVNSNELKARHGAEAAENIFNESIVESFSPLARIAEALETFETRKLGRLELEHVGENENEFFFSGGGFKREPGSGPDIMPLDFFAAAFIEKLLGGIYKKNMVCFEYQCETQGAPCCRFYAAASNGTVNSAGPEVKRILYAEDEPRLMKLVAAALSKTGIKVDMAADGLEAVEAAKVRKYDLIILDLMKPDMDGIEALRIIRESEPGSAAPVLILSAYADVESVSKMKKLNISGYIRKPFSARMLLEKVKNFV